MGEMCNMHDSCPQGILGKGRVSWTLGPSFLSVLTAPVVPRPTGVLGAAYRTLIFPVVCILTRNLHISYVRGLSIQYGIGLQLSVYDAVELLSLHSSTLRQPVETLHGGTYVLPNANLRRGLLVSSFF